MVQGASQDPELKITGFIDGDFDNWDLKNEKAD